VAQVIGVPSLPAKPKIVVLGATGGVGRLVVRQLMSTNVDMTVVAFCRNYEKALETLYDGAGDTDDDDNQGGTSMHGRSLVQRNSKRGPKLEIVVGDLVDRSKVFNYKDEEDEIEVEFNTTTLASVRRFYGDGAADEVYKASSKQNDGETTDAHEALKQAIKDCTAIISCVGTVRPTNPWTDYVINPLRIFRKASRWCSDPRHPYYVNYQSTREALALAEEEQSRRDTEIEKFEQAEEAMAKEAAKMGRSYIPANGGGHKKGPVERIKFVRISDLAVSIRPWKVVSLFTNIGRSLVFRDQEKCEILLENNNLIDTVTLRPGDLIDTPRNANTTNIQMDASGVLPYPAYVSKEDVAAVAVAAALTRKDGFTAAAKEDRHYEEDVGGKSVKKRRRKGAYESRGGAAGKDKATSYTWAVRWCGQNLEGQGRKSDGLPDAQSCVDRMLQLENSMEAKRKKVNSVRDGDSMQRVISKMTGPLKRRRLKPYGVAVAVPIYAVMAAIFFSALRNVPGKEMVLKYVVKRLSGA